MSLNETLLIEALHAQFPTYIGDDAAVLPLYPNAPPLITTDLLLEDIHFRRRYTTPEDLAHKALQVNLSDLAAMGAKPEFVLLSVAIPEDAETYMPAFLNYFALACQKMQVQLVGGDTTASPQGIFINVTALGQASPTLIKYRHQAQVHDVIAYVGALGHAHIGLTALEKNHLGFESFKTCFLRPKARLNESQWLSPFQSLHAMMDLSDGLYMDLLRLCKRSNCGAQLRLEALEHTPLFLEACTALNLDPFTIALTGGEDYGLLLCIDPMAYSEIEAQFQAEFHTPLIPIGEIVESEGLILTQDGKPVSMKIQPFTHFGEHP